MDTPDTDDVPARRRPACDNCKTRKTRCDRKSPCSGCVALQVDCRITRRSPEKRQRVLISDKYTEAVQDVNRKLDDISKNLQRIAGRQETFQPAVQGSGVASQPSTLSSFPRATQHGFGIDLDACSDFRGNSSFEAHARQLKDHLEKRFDIQCLIYDQHDQQSKAGGLLFSGLPLSTSNTSFANLNTSTQALGQSMTEPCNEQALPTDLVLKVLRLTQVEKQRVFVDIPIIDEDEFASSCSQVYFASKSPSTSAQAIATVGLYYILHDLDMGHYSAIGLTTSLVDSYLYSIRGQAYTVCQNLRLCMDSSFEICQALSLLGMFCLKDGRIKAAWKLLSSAAHMCMDLGMKCNQQNDRKDQVKSKRLIWWVYAINQSLALTLGRTPAIRRHDIDLGSFHLTTSHPGISSPLYAMLYDFPTIVEDINDGLFSIEARKTTIEERSSRADLLEEKLKEMQRKLKQANQDEPERDMMFLHATILFEIMLYSLLALVQQPTMLDGFNTMLPNYSDACIDSSRKAVEALVQVGGVSQPARSSGWGMFLNLAISMVPFVPFVVLSGNAIATSSSVELTLLEAAIDLMRPTAADSPVAQCIQTECEHLYRIAKRLTRPNQRDQGGSNLGAKKDCKA